MAITIPNKITSFKELEKDFGTTIATALWLKAAQVQNYVNASIPIGKLWFVRTVQPGATTPDPKYWQLMDGSIVTNTESPLYGWTTWNLTNRFPRPPTGSESVGNPAGSTSVNLRHRHSIEAVANIGRFQTDDNNDVRTGQLHTHTVSNELDAALDPTPLFYSYKVYVRIV